MCKPSLWLLPALQAFSRWWTLLAMDSLPSLFGVHQVSVGEALPASRAFSPPLSSPSPRDSSLPHDSCVILGNFLLPILYTESKAALIQKVGSGRELLSSFNDCPVSGESNLTCVCDGKGEKWNRSQDFYGILKWILNEIKYCANPYFYSDLPHIALMTILYCQFSVLWKGTD